MYLILYDSPSSSEDVVGAYVFQKLGNRISALPAFPSAEAEAFLRCGDGSASLNFVPNSQILTIDLRKCPDYNNYFEPGVVPETDEAPFLRHNSTGVYKLKFNGRMFVQQ